MNKKQSNSIRGAVYRLQRAAEFIRQHATGQAHHEQAMACETEAETLRASFPAECNRTIKDIVRGLHG